MVVEQIAMDAITIEQLVNIIVIKERRMRLLFILSAIFLSSCTSVDYNIKSIRHNEVGLDEHFADKIFIINCGGNGYTGAGEVDSECRKYMAQFAHNMMYDYFTVINSGADSSTSVGHYTTSTPVTTYSNASVYSGGYSAHGYGTSTTYVPQTHAYAVTRHYSSYLFILIEPKDINNWKNYYKVSDYYIPELNS